MKSSLKRRWVVGLALLMILAPLFFLWWYGTGPGGKVYPIEKFMPDQLSAAVRLSDARQAWERHWQSRRGPAPEDALQSLMVALEEWPRWIKKYGETGARMRLNLYEQAFFHALGDEAWLMFGEWGGQGKPGTGQVGLVVFLKADSSIKTQVGPLVELLMEDYKLERSVHQGVTLFSYQDRRVDRSLTFCRLGGWICASLTQRGPGPLPALIDQIRSTSEQGEQPSRLAHIWASEVPESSAISFAAEPKAFLDQLQRFTAVRGKSFSKKSAKRLAYWRQQLDGVDQVLLTQGGNSLFDLRLAAQGARPALLNQAVGGGDDAPGSSSLELKAPAPSADPPAAPQGLTPRAELAQVDLSLALAREFKLLAGVDLGEALGEAKFLKWLSPGLKPLLERQLNSPASQAGRQERIGLGAFPASQTLLPGLLFWCGVRPEGTAPGAPAQGWAPLAGAPQAESAEEQCFWLTPPGTDPSARGTEADRHAQWLLFEDQAWRKKPTPPIAFVAANFHSLADEVPKIPTVLMKKKERKKVERWHSTLQALALGVGGAVLRLDGEADRWLLSLETPERL